MAQDSHISVDNAPMSLGRITFIVLSLACTGGGVFAGLSGAWQGLLFAAFWLPMIFIGVTGRPRVLFDPVVVEGVFEAEGFRSYGRLDYQMLLAMSLTGLSYILLAAWWPRLPHFPTGLAVLYLFFATAVNAYLWQRDIGPQKLLVGYLTSMLMAGVMLGATDPRETPSAVELLYLSAWGILYSGVALRRKKNGS